MNDGTDQELTARDLAACSDAELRARGMSDANIADLRASRDATDAFENHYPAVTPPCPKWCVGEPGHEYELVTPGENGPVFGRFHATKQAPYANVTQLENNEGGVLSFPEPPTVSAWIGDGAELSAEQATKAATDLLTAADDLTRIERDDS